MTQGGPTTIVITSSMDDGVNSLLVSGSFAPYVQSGGALNLTFNPGSTLTIGTGGEVVTGGVTESFSGNLGLASGSLVIGTATSTIDAGLVSGPGTLNVTAGTTELDSALATSLIVSQNSSGGTSALNQSSTSTVNTGKTVEIGQGGGTGVYTLSGTSVLNIGDLGAGKSASYVLNIGDGSAVGGGSSGMLTISGSSVLNATNANTAINIGTNASSAMGIVTQSGSSTVTLGGNTLKVGNTGTGTYNLQAGTLNITNTTTSLGLANGSGTLTQSGGALMVGAATSFIVGNGGTGLYTLSAGTADFLNGFKIGNNGTVTQTGGTLTSENMAQVGTAGQTAVYNMNGGSATFSGGLNVGGTSTVNVSAGTLSLGTTVAASLVVGANATVNQTGGTVTIDPTTSQTLNLSAVGGSYDLNGGTLQIGNTATNGFVGTTNEGTFNFGGGTLQVAMGTAMTLTDALDGTVTGTSTLDTTNGNIALTGTLTGTGTLTVTGGGNLDVTGVGAGSQAASWGLNIANGSANANTSTFPSAGNVVIGSGGAGAMGTFNLGVAGTQALTGSISSNGGSGTAIFNATFAANNDTLEVATFNFNGTTNLIGGGTLQVFNGTIGNITGAGSAVTVGGDPTIASSGTFNFTGTNSYTGATTINSGFTAFSSNFAGAVSNAGTLGSNAVLTAVQGTPTLTVGGTLGSTGTLSFRVNSVNADLFKVTGADANLTGTSYAVVKGSGSGTYTILSTNAPGDLIGAPTVHSSSTLFSYTIMPDAQNQNLILTTQQQTLAGFGTTANERAVGGALDPLVVSGSTDPSFVSLLTVFNGLAAGDIPGALEQLSPESLQYARDIAFENATVMVHTVNSAMDGIHSGMSGLNSDQVNIINPGFNSGLGRSLGSLLAYNSPSYHQAAPNGVNYYPNDDDVSPATAPESASSPRSDSSGQTISDSPVPLHAFSGPTLRKSSFNEFIGGDIILADLNRDHSATNAPSGSGHYTAGDVIAGVSFRMTSNLAAGVLFDYNHTDARTDSNGSKIKVDSYAPGLFATFFDKGFYANGLFSFGYNKYANTRSIPFLGDTATSSPSGQQYVTNLDLGYDFVPDNHWTVGPTAGLTYTHLDVDSFTESGAGPVDLTVKDQSADSLRSRLGGHVVYQARSGAILFQPNVTAMWQHEFLDDNSGITSQLGIPGSGSFTIQTVSRNKDSALLGAGMTVTLDNSMAFYLNYFADVGTDSYLAQSVMGGVKAQF